MDSVELVILTALTYVLPPADFVHPRIGFNVALKVDVGALLDARTVARLIGAKLQCHDRNVYMSENEEEESDERNFITAFLCSTRGKTEKAQRRKHSTERKLFLPFLRKKREGKAETRKRQRRSRKKF